MVIPLSCEVDSLTYAGYGFNHGAAPPPRVKKNFSRGVDKHGGVGYSIIIARAELADGAERRSKMNSNIIITKVRDEYGAITNLPSEILGLISKVKEAAGWEIGITSNGMRRGGYESRSIDVYGYDVERQLAVIQIRRAWKKKASWYVEVSKAYALVGIDDGQIFSHPLASSPRRNPNLCAMTPEDVVTWAEAKIFGIPVAKLPSVIRQGDIALVPSRIPANATALGDLYEHHQVGGVHNLTMRGSHVINVDGKVLAADDKVYADGAIEIVHKPGQHKTISAQGRYRIVQGERAGNPWWINAEMGD